MGAPKTVRLNLSDVATRAHAELIATGKATPDQISASEVRVSLAIADGRTIDVKRRLNTGEQQDLFAAMAPTLMSGERATLQTKSVMTAKVLAYLLSWYGINHPEDGQPLPMTPFMSDDERLSSLRATDPDDFRDIREAIDWHEAEVEREIAEAKKIRGGASASSSSLPSPDAVTGGTAMSVN